MLLCYVLLLASVQASAQRVYVRGRVIDGRNNLPLNGAQVTLMSLEDTASHREVSTGVDGKFYAYGLRSIGRYLLIVQSTGYAKYVKGIEVRGGNDDDLGNLVMIDSARMMQEAIIKAERKPFTIKGDTVEYSASYYKTNPDLDAVYLINKMPGIDLKDMRAQGDSITQLQINGIVIFGEPPTDILRQLPAGFVDKVQLFSDTASRVGTGAPKGKVLNVKTKGDALALPKGKATVGGGTSGVFIAAANAIRQKKTTQMSADAQVSRGGVQPGLYFEPSYPYSISGNPLRARLSLNYSGNITPKDRLEAGYYGSGYQNTLNSTTTSQYNLPDGANSFTRNSSRRDERNQYHSLSTRFVHTQTNKNRLILNVRFGSSAQKSDEVLTLDALIAGVTQQMQGTYKTNSLRSNLSSLVSYNIAGNERRGGEVGLRYTGTWGGEDATSRTTNRIDDTSFEQGFVNDRTGRNGEVNAFANGYLRLNAHHTLNASLDGELTASRNGQARRLFAPATNTYSEPDTEFTYRVDYDAIRASAEVKDVVTLDSGRTTLEGGCAVQYYHLRDAAGRFTKAFIGVNPFLKFKRQFAPQKKLELEVEGQTELPSFDDINPVINVTAPYLYSLGNLNIRPAPRYDFRASYQSPLSQKGALFNTRLSLVWIRHNISNALLIPAGQDAYFEGRQIPAGIRLSYAQNVGDYRYLYYGIGVDAPVPALKMTVKLKARCDIRSTDVLLNYQLSNTTGYTYAASTTLSSIISEALDFVLYGSASYNYTVQSRDGTHTGRWLKEYQMNALVTAMLDKRQSVRLEANFNSTSGLFADKPTSYFLLDPRYQIKVLKNKQLALSVTLHDALNSYKNFGNDYRDNAIYSYYNSAIGRYVLFMGQYTF